MSTAPYQDKVVKEVLTVIKVKLIDLKYVPEGQQVTEEKPGIRLQKDGWGYFLMESAGSVEELKAFRENLAPHAEMVTLIRLGASLWVEVMPAAAPLPKLRFEAVQATCKLQPAMLKALKLDQSFLDLAPNLYITEREV